MYHVMNFNFGTMHRPDDIRTQMKKIKGTLYIQFEWR